MELQIENWMLAFARSSAFIGFLPIFSGPSIPIRFRLALSAMLALLVMPGMGPVSAFSDLGGLTMLLVREFGAGALLGFTARMVFFAADFGGRLISNEMGLHMGAVMDPLNSGMTQAPGLIMFLLTGMLMFTLDMHHWLLLGFQRAYAVLPVGMARLNEASLADFTEQTGRVIIVGVQMAAPLVAVSFVIILVMALLGRAVPQMNVFTESFSIRVLTGLMVFGLVLEIMAQHIINYLRRLPEDMIFAARLLAGA